MKVFTGENSAWAQKVNFVDDSNVSVGYDMSEQCCEHASWFISKTKDIEHPPSENCEQADENIIEPYSFDVSSFETVEEARWLDEGGMVRFRLIALGLPDLFLHLFNSHNGYYSHGFEMKNGDEVLHESYL